MSFEGSGYAKYIWDKTTEQLEAMAKDAGTQRRFPSIAGRGITTEPPNSTDPESITLKYSYDGRNRDVYRDLTIERTGQASLRERIEYWDFTDDRADIDVTYGPDSTYTLQYLARTAGAIRSTEETTR